FSGGDRWIELLGNTQYLGIQHVAVHMASSPDRGCILETLPEHPPGDRSLAFPNPSPSWRAPGVHIGKRNGTILQRGDLLFPRDARSAAQARQVSHHPQIGYLLGCILVRRASSRTRSWTLSRSCQGPDH